MIVSFYIFWDSLLFQARVSSCLLILDVLMCLAPALAGGGPNAHFIAESFSA